MKTGDRLIKIGEKECLETVGEKCKCAQGRYVRIYYFEVSE